MRDRGFCAHGLAPLAKRVGDEVDEVLLLGEHCARAVLRRVQGCEWPCTLSRTHTLQLGLWSYVGAPHPTGRSGLGRRHLDSGSGFWEAGGEGGSLLRTGILTAR
eukprot:6213324-Pleurochrysis_carterae.AAC.2